jgi:hypothetical protein
MRSVLSVWRAHFSRKRTAPKPNRNGVDPKGEHCKWQILSGVYGVSDLALCPFSSCSELFDFEAQGKRGGSAWSEDPTNLIKVIKRQAAKAALILRRR